MFTLTKMFDVDDVSLKCLVDCMYKDSECGHMLPASLGIALMLSEIMKSALLSISPAFLKDICIPMVDHGDRHPVLQAVFQALHA